MANHLMKIKYELSEELADIIGLDEASRPEVVKRLWVYIKKNDCQEGRIIHPDATLAKVLGKGKIDMLKMQKKLTPHLTRIE